ncbi:MAG: hypothetical protein A2675_00300 [Candidatus Yonathbacteria bacterium RIFCSPHIGHO2_01_FULL_51_10]|uniref:Peptidase C39-like domain-containing protein n=1 Tax=Candidatus Yonathbacteria bacterium RIFCSPHIGHO2_01_FULL_51_10 TaxID=1802723 RepID=A0A1G2S7R6_9BACT|nr:MAG: hypothetical protein A2675_00300 [Candidatus Yonathbacteria bacterium RIFCSPHIGHO2_01_FULL_51_10]
MKLDVPYHSQFLDVEDKNWMPRACAIVCLKMVLECHKKDVSIEKLIEEGIKIKEYTSVGWRHDTLVQLAEMHGLSARREEGLKESGGIEKVVDAIKKGEPVIISAVKFILGQTKFHMVVVTGIEEENGKVIGFYYHDPESLDKEKARHLFVGREVFEKEWRGMAVFVSK